MTDKQIIIDGVDVHWCEHYTGNISYLTDKNWTCRARIQGTKCEDWSNCYFKRWQRKEQECEELKKWLPIVTRLEMAFGSIKTEKAKAIDYNTYAGEIFNQLDQLKAENDELKKANIHIDNNRMVKADKLKRIEDLIIACSSGYTDEFIQNLLVILHEPEPSFKSKLYQTLTEIKEIAQYDVYTPHTDLCIKLNRVKKKISEVENE